MHYTCIAAAEMSSSSLNSVVILEMPGEKVCQYSEITIYVCQFLNETTAQFLLPIPTFLYHHWSDSHFLPVPFQKNDTEVSITS